VLALHACDTATDDALARGLRWRAPVILAAPWSPRHSGAAAAVRATAAAQPVTRHGILRERLADVLTDAMRAAILRLAGYRVGVARVPSRPSTTPRNVLIRAVRTGAPPTAQLIEEYAALVHEWSVRPYLADLVADHLPQQLR
jgi:hypothetical protein